MSLRPGQLTEFIQKSQAEDKKPHSHWRTSFEEGQYQPEPAEEKSKAANGGDGSEPFRTGDCQQIETPREEEDANPKSPACNRERDILEEML